MDGNVISVERVVPGSPGQVFALLSDASRHQEIDGSGSLRGARSAGPQPLRLGSVFGMSMKLGLPYWTQNEVVEYEENRLIAWRTRGPGRLEQVIGGRIWRYELQPVQGGTLVRETWDITDDTMRLGLLYSPFPSMTQKNMSRSLERIERVVSAR